MDEHTIAEALTSGMLYPTVGAILVLLSWLVARIRHGVPVLEQLKHAGLALFGALPMALSAGGAALLAGLDWRKALALTLTSMMMAAGLTAPKPTADK